MQKHFFFIFVLFTLGLASNLKDKRIELSGFTSLKLYLYPQSNKEQFNKYLFYSRPEVSFNLSDKSKAFASVNLQAQNEWQIDLALNESFITMDLGKLRIDLGKQKILWGRGDWINPTDHFALIDYSDIEDVAYKRAGVFAMRSRCDFKWCSFDLVALPFHQLAKLPENSVWNFKLPQYSVLTLNNNAIKFENIFQILNEDSLYLNKPSFGTKVDFCVPNFDFSFSYFHGYEYISQIRNVDTTLNIGNQTIQFNILNYIPKRKNVGFDFSSTVIPFFDIRGEVTSSIDPHTYIFYNVGIDKVFSNVFSNELYISINWLHKVHKKEFKYEDAFSYSFLFEKGGGISTEYTFDYRFKLGVDAAYDFNYELLMVTPDIDLKLNDRLNTNIACNFLDSRHLLFKDKFDNFIRFKVELMYYF